MNCMIVDDDELSSGVLNQLIAQIGGLHVIKVCKCPLEALSFLRTEQVDLLFLDVEMPAMTGFSLMRNMDHPPLVILTTSHTKYALEAFENNVVDYLVKPVELPRLVRSTEKAKKVFDQAQKLSGSFIQDFLFLKKNAVLEKVPVKNIQWIEAQGDYVEIHTCDGNYVLHITLKAVEKKLPQDKFLRIHRSFIIQLEHIGSIDENVVCIGNKLLPVGSLFRDKFMTRLNLLL